MKGRNVTTWLNSLRKFFFDELVDSAFACMGIVVYIATHITLKPLRKFEDDISALKDYDFSYKSKYYIQDQFEAARAEETEKRFTVVAEEIRKLQEVMEQIHSLAAIAEENSASSEDMSANVIWYSQ